MKHWFAPPIVIPIAIVILMAVIVVVRASA